MLKLTLGMLATATYVDILKECAPHDIKKIRELGLSIHLPKLASFKITTSFRTLVAKCAIHTCVNRHRFTEYVP